MDAFEAALAASNVGLEVRFLFQHDGVYQLLTQQDNQAIAHKSMLKKLSALPLFDIEDVYVDKYSVEQRSLSLSQDTLEWQSLNTHETMTLIESAKEVLIF